MKCDQYWPARGTEAYGLIHVSLVDVVELATYTVRTFQLARVRRGATHTPLSTRRLLFAVPKCNCTHQRPVYQLLIIRCNRCYKLVLVTVTIIFLTL